MPYCKKEYDDEDSSNINIGKKRQVDYVREVTHFANFQLDTKKYTCLSYTM